MHRLRKTILTLAVSVCCCIAAAQPCDFTINNASGCVPLSGVNFTDITAGVVTRNWNLGNGTLINNGAATVGTNYLNAGTYNVTLTVFYSTGDSCIKIKTVTVHPKPTAQFFSNDTAGCVNHTASFTDQSTTPTGFINNWQWDFGAGGSALQNPSFTYAAAGSYQVSLVVTNNWGCVSDALTRPNYIQVYPRPQPSFTTNINYSCDTTLAVQFTNTTTGPGPITYLWNFGDGQTSTQPNPQHTYNGAGVYTVTLTAQIGNGCTAVYTSTAANNIQLGAPQATIVTAPDTICAAQNAFFAGSSTPAALTGSVRWVFTDDNTTVNGFSANHAFATGGNYTVLFITTSPRGCADTAIKTVFVRTGITADFTADKPKGCAVPWTVQFNSTVGPSSTGGYAYLWNFGDGQTSTQLNPQHIYTAQGLFTVTLTVTDTTIANGCQTVRQKINYIEIRIPVVNFTAVPQSGCKPLPVLFTAQVSNLVEPVTQYQWDFGDGFTQTGTSANGLHIYTQTGVFNAQLTITTQQGCTAVSAFRPIAVIDTCIDDGTGGGAGGAGFTVTKNCNNKYEVVFTDTVSNAVVVKWDFGDGTQATVPPLNPVTHIYTPPQKEYYVTVIRRDTLTNVLDTGTKKVVIIDEHANFQPSLLNICPNIPITFSTLGIDSSKINLYQWHFGDGTPVQTLNNQQYYQATGLYLNGNINHTFTDTGVFFVQLVITDKLGCIDSFTYPLPITVRGPSPRFGAQPLTSCQTPFPVVFTDSSVQNGSTPIVQWSWNFGDGSPVYNTTLDTAVNHAFINNTFARFYTVALTVTDALGCSATLTKPAYIKAYKPVAGFNSADTLQCNVYTVFLANTSQAYNASYTWYFGDGATAGSFHGNHTYAGDGIYDVKLVVTDENGCIDSITKPAYVKIIKPKADFSIGDTTRCAPAIIQFRDSSLYATSWNWNFGDGGTGSTSPFPAPHIYAAPGFYNIKLTIGSVNGCTDSITKTIRVRGPIGNLQSSTGDGCKPFTLGMRVTGQFISTYAWDFNDGTPVVASPADSVVTHTYPNAGAYLPNVVLTSPEGCTYTLRATDTVYVDSAMANFNVNFNACATIPVQFLNASAIPYFSSIIKYKWSFGDGGTDSIASPQHTYNTPGVYDVMLVIWTKYGCVDTLFVPGAVKVNALPAATILGDTLFCKGGPYTYQSSVVSVDAIANYEWFVNSLPVAPSGNTLTHNFYAGTSLLELKVTTINGCSYTAQRWVKIDSIKASFAPNIPLICGNDGQVQFFNSTFNLYGIQQYNWAFGDGTFAIDTHPTHAYISFGDYTVTLIATSVNGCRDTLVKPDAVKVHPNPDVTIVGDSILCKSGLYTYQANISSADPIFGVKWFLDTVQVGTGLSLQYYFPPGTHQLTVAVRTVNNCPDTARRTIIVDSLRAGFRYTPARICADSASVQFTDTSGGYYNLISHYWSFGDGQNSTTASPLHPYAQPGVYDVQLVVGSVHGCTDTLFIPQAVKIYKPPRAAITGDSIRCRPGVYTYNGIITSTDAVSQKQWWVNGVPASTNNNLVYSFTAGLYTLRFAIATVNGCTDTVTRQIIVDSLRAGFTVTPPRICAANGNVQFTNTSGSHFGIAGYSWQLGDGNSTGVASPAHFYTAPGHYNVQLVAHSVHGCTDTLLKPEAVIIYGPPQVNIVSVNEKCQDGTIHFSAAVLSEDSVSAYTWRINNAIVSSDTAFDHTFPVAGIYVVSLNIKTRYGCDVTINKNITIHPAPVPNAAPDTLVCKGSPVQLHAFDGSQYLWSPATGLNNAQLAQPVATPQQTTLYQVRVTNIFGCIKNDSVLVRVDEPVNLQRGPDQVICERGTVQLTASGNVLRYEWSPALSLNNANIANPLATPTQTTTYQVIGYSPNVCPNDTGVVVVILEPDPKVNLGPDITVNAGTTVSLNPQFQGNITQYFWQPATGLSCISCPTTQFGADKNITYKLKVVTQHGCTATDEVNVVVNCSKGAIYIPSAFTPNNDGVNDRFYIQGFGLSIVKNFRIYNRWGKVVFSRSNFVANSADMGWDGTVNGKRVNETATFVYIVDVLCASNNEPFTLKGTVTLIR